MDTDRAPRACTVSELESIQAFPSGSSHGIMSDFCKRSILASLVRSFSSRVDLDLEASRSFRPTPHTKFGVISCSRTLSGPWHTGLGSGLSEMHSCLAWSRFGRSRQKANTALCVYSAMIEGMRYKVYLLLQGLVSAPSYGYGQSSPCMHSCLAWSRFRRYRQEAHTVSYGILRKVEPDL